MYDPTIHFKTLARQVRKSDFAGKRPLAVPQTLPATIERAVAIGIHGFGPLALRRSNLRGKDVYQLRDLADALVVRHITSNIRRVTGVKQDDRQFIASCLQKMLSEGTPFRVYKFDIASFYENVSAEMILKRLESDTAFSGQSVKALRSLFIRLDAAGVVGIPRGLAISATLGEYLLRDFDKEAATTRGVWFFARFVDDISIVTDGREDAAEFQSLLAERLPSGLTFNRKSANFDFQAFTKGNTSAPEHAFDFLGYRFSVSLAHRNKLIDDRIRRHAWLDIAPSKVRKIKTRVARSLLAYSLTGDFDLLLDRFRMLTSNYTYLDLKSGVERTSGIYCNYPLIDISRSTALSTLDRFVLNLLTAAHPANRLRPVLTNKQKQRLLNLRFQDGFRNRRLFSFSAERLAEITDCWAYA